MWRQYLALVVAFAVSVFGLNPQLSAQEQYPPNGSDPNAGYSQPPSPEAQQPPPAGSTGGWPSSGSTPSAPGDPSGNAGGGDPDAIDPNVAAQHGVARLSVVVGDVNIKRLDTGELVAAAVNAPIVGSDRVQTGPGSRAELELDYVNLLRVGPDTDVGFSKLERHRFQVQLGAGTVISRVIRNGASSIEIDTPSIAVHPTAEGVYRISVGQDGATQIAVRVGNAEVYSPRGTQQLGAGQTMLVRGDPSNPEFLDNPSVEQDQFEDWSINRDRTLLQSQSYQHVSPEMEGTEDLDANGSWVPSQYGQVWAPRPPSADWSPYSDGHWVYADDYYGWSWVGAEPWGWAPYHYGRWFWNGGYGWSWWPGPVSAGLYWSPALVGFFGFGVGLAAGIGWAALAPFEICHPWWGHGGGWGYRGGFGYRGGWGDHGFGPGRGGYGFGGFRGNVAGMYRNAAFRGGAITASYNQFGSHFGRFGTATREQLANGSSFRGGIPIRPTAASYQFTNRQAFANTRLNTVSSRSFFTSRGGFARSTGGGQQPFGNGGGRAVFAQSSAGQRQGVPVQQQHGIPPNLGNNGAGRSGQSSSSSGWQRFGNTTGANGYRQGFSSGTTANGGTQQGGWHSFGRAESPGISGANRSYGGSRSPYGNQSTGRQPQGFSSSQPRQQAPPQQRQPAQRYGGGMYSNNNGMYGGGAYRGGSPSMQQQRQQVPSYGGASGRSNAPPYSQPRSNSRPNYGGYGGGSSSPRYNQPSFGGSHGGGGGSASPHYSGSGGGGGRSFGGGGGGHSGGGGGHSSGGGGGHHR